jgi:hypothetical protein
MRTHIRYAILASSLLAMIGSQDAKAQSPRGAPSSDIRGCFVRDYDKPHLSRHPDQVVTNVRLVVKDAPANTAERLEYILEVRLRGRREALRTAGYCREKGAGYFCHVECDGGGVEVQLRGPVAMMYLADRIRMSSCGKVDVDGSEDLMGGVDDREFRLDRVGGGGGCSDLRYP